MRPVISVEILSSLLMRAAPCLRSAFVANACVVKILAALKEGRFEETASPDGALLEFLRHKEILESGPEFSP